ncbi:hypothetical protein, partial [Streptomyces lavendulocolor]|uniref:hypothetical protein n=1 Tax=Streptomyces lavendulocolor TaxID=67316 RepID=UPI003C2EB59F
LSTDPIHGGGDNRYGYPGDPINQYDLDGKRWYNPVSWVRKWRKHRQRHASADMLHSAVMFGVGVSSFGRVSSIRRAVKLRNSRRCVRSWRGAASCGWSVLGVAGVSDTAWYGRNVYRHTKRFAWNGLAYAYNSFTPRYWPRYTYRSWRGRF